MSSRDSFKEGPELGKRTGPSLIFRVSLLSLSITKG